MTSFTPPDGEEQTKLHLKEKGGCCGQACIAVVQRLPIKEVFERWQRHNLEWKGHTTIKQFREYMDKEGYDTKLITTKNGTNWKAPFYFIRIQWLGEGDKKEKPFYGHPHWTIASAYTHFVLREGNRFFCNENGWFDAIDQYLECEEPKGTVTSVYEIVPRQRQTETEVSGAKALRTPPTSNDVGIRAGDLL